MKARRQSGITLVETAVAAGIVAVALGGTLFALAQFGRYVRQQGGPARTAALVAAEQTLRVAQNAWKYGSPGTAPSGTQTIALPITEAAAAPATITTTIAGSGTSAQITVTVRYTPEPGRNDSGVVTMSGQLAVKAPLPGSHLERPGLVPMPSGAP
ncbi:MAG TPA: hypothetical protein VFN37_02420 [Candidatus Baltobacteraceae bacterium]|nr:hypothetical protein [Candidatus Baltobacteraceae bacterium]